MKAIALLPTAAAVLSGILSLPANAAIVTYSTNAAQTGFGGVSLTLNSSAGPASATLSFDPLAPVAVGTPSNISYGGFTLVCATCTTQAGGIGAIFGAFSFNLVVTDSTDGATGLFVGTSSGGNVWSDVSQINISWLPVALGPGTSNASTGDFGATTFGITSASIIVAPNSGDPQGFTSVAGFVNTQALPEPRSFALMGAGLIALGMFQRRSSTKQ